MHQPSADEIGEHSHHRCAPQPGAQEEGISDDDQFLNTIKTHIAGITDRLIKLGRAVGDEMTYRRNRASVPLLPHREELERQQCILADHGIRRGLLPMDTVRSEI